MAANPTHSQSIFLTRFVFPRSSTDRCRPGAATVDFPFSGEYLPWRRPAGRNTPTNAWLKYPANTRVNYANPWNCGAIPRAFSWGRGTLEFGKPLSPAEIACSLLGTAFFCSKPTGFLCSGALLGSKRLSLGFELWARNNEKSCSLELDMYRKLCL